MVGCIVVFVGLIVVWHLVVKAQIWSPLLLPSPLNVLDYLRSAAERHSLGSHVGHRTTAADGLWLGHSHRTYPSGC